MTPIKFVIYKEYRQQSPLAGVMLLLCFTLQLAAFISSVFFEKNISTDAVLGIALFTTALFAGAAAAISFSGEHEDKTFNFLRSLPMSPMNVMLGKTIWLIIGTVGVLVFSLIFSLIVGLMLSTYSDTGNVIGTFGVGIIEAFVWGLFWSPRCRSQVFALLSTYFCASASSFIAANLLNSSPDLMNNYCAAVPLRLGICSVVAFFAVRGMLYWFDNAVQKRGKSQWFTLENFAVLRYPPKRLSPFFAMLRQSFLQSQSLILCGIVVALYVCFCIGSVFLTYGVRFFSIDDAQLVKHLSSFGCLLLLGSAPFYVVFSACIFGQDQKNESFRFLSRSGISPRLVWWSRFLPFFAVVFAVFLVLVFFLFLTLRYAVILDMYIYDNIFGNSPVDWNEIFDFFSITCSNLLVPIAVGAYVSISMRSMMVSIALTGAGTFLLIGWSLFGMGYFRFNPLWTTLPICIALLAASRLRTTDWLREKRTWRSRFYSLTPVVVTFMVILAAVPAVRVYSFPFISLARIEERLNNTPLPEGLSLEERNTLFREMEARLPLSLMEAALRKSHWSIVLQIREQLTPKDFASLSSLERCKIRIKIAKAVLEAEIPFEAELVRNCEYMHRSFNSSADVAYGRKVSSGEKILHFYMTLPWEKARAMRIGHLQLYLILQDIERGGNGHVRIPAFNYHELGLIDDIMLVIVSPLDTMVYFEYQRRGRLDYIAAVLECWYLEHNNTLPKSLDELVGEYIKAVPTDPLTGEPMQYEPNRDKSLRLKKGANAHDNSGRLYKPGWQHIEFCGYRERDKYVCDLVFLPGYDEYGKP